MKVRVTTLVENTAGGRHVRGEHGLSFWIELGDRRVLFDTGQSFAVLRHNAVRLGAELSAAEAVVLSHGHYDHSGGLAGVLMEARRPRLLLHREALRRRFSRQADGVVEDVAMPVDTSERLLHERSEVVWTDGATEAAGGLWATGPVPRETAYEDTGGDFFLDEACVERDPIRDDQAMYFDTDEGLVVLLGCAHSGVVNTLHHVRALSGGRPVRAAIGGMHLVRASAERMDRTVSAFGDLGLALLAPAHCTGAEAVARLCLAFGGVWRRCAVGSRFEFDGFRG